MLDINIYFLKCKNQDVTVNNRIGISRTLSYHKSIYKFWQKLVRVSFCRNLKSSPKLATIREKVNAERVTDLPEGRAVAFEMAHLPSSNPQISGGHEANSLNLCRLLVPEGTI